MADYPIYRLAKGSQLTFTEMDNNLNWLSANMSASQVTITGSTVGISGETIFDGDIQVLGTASIGFVKADYFSSGSNTIGDDVSDTQTLIGTVTISGSFNVTGSANVPDLTGSLFGTASYAITAISSSWPVSASYIMSGAPTSLYSIALDTDKVANESSVVLGWRAGKNKKSLGYDVFVGDFAGYIDNGLPSSSVSLGNTFIGSWAGYNANYSQYSTMVGDAAGLSASYSDFSTFVGRQAGLFATSASNAVFLGRDAGYEATFASRSIFIGTTAGAYANNSAGAVFIGPFAGSTVSSFSASNAYDAVFIGRSAGAAASFSSEAIFLGRQAGQQAYRANNSLFAGYLAGSSAISSSNSIFLGTSAGRSNSNASHSIFLGYQVGFNGASALGANNTIIGTNITLPAGYSNYANIGAVLYVSGTYATVTGNPRQTAMTGRVGINQVNPQFNFDVSGSGRYTDGLQITGSLNVESITGSLFGTSSFAVSASWAPTQAPVIEVTGSTIYSVVPSRYNIGTTVESVVIGNNAYTQSSANRDYSTVIGASAGLQSSGDARYSVMLGYQAGMLAKYDQGNVGLGAFAMYSSSGTYDPYEITSVGYQTMMYSENVGSTSVLGTYSGYGSKNLDRVTIVGIGAGQTMDDVQATDFIGYDAGYTAKNIRNSLYMGFSSGRTAISSSGVIAIGYNASYGTQGNNNIITIGHKAGNLSSGSSYSILLGYNVGNIQYAPFSRANSVGRNNIIIGTNISLPGGRQDSINLGAIIFATGSYFNGTEGGGGSSGNNFSGSVGNGKVGINVVDPQFNLDVSGSGRYTSDLQVTGSVAVTQNFTASAALITGTITAQTLVVSTISSSVTFSSGSNIFGNNLSNTQTMTGSVNVTGSMTVIGRVTAQNITGSLSGSATLLENTGSTGFVSNMGDTYTGTAKITNIITLTAAEYSGIGSPASDTLYVVI